MQGGLKGLKEWNEGYEDLEAIAFSFVVEFKDGRGFWSMYADTEEEKVRTLSVQLNGAYNSAVQNPRVIQGRGRTLKGSL